MTVEANVAGRPMSPGGQCHFGPGRSMSPLAGEANVREVNVGEANVIAPHQLAPMEKTQFLL